MWVKERSRGFTIVELLIVIVVIAILAAITIVSYAGITNRANDAAVQDNLANMAKQLQIYNVDNSTYPRTVADLTSVGLKVTKASFAISPTVTVNVAYCPSTGFTGFALFAMSKSGNRFYVTESGRVGPDTTGAYWDSTTANLSGLCTAAGYTTPLTHGYVSTDTTTGPWRTWAVGS